jgi:hypothetical protein
MVPLWAGYLCSLVCVDVVIYGRTHALNICNGIPSLFTFYRRIAVKRNNIPRRKRATRRTPSEHTVAAKGTRRAVRAVEL